MPLLLESHSSLVNFSYTHTPLSPLLFDDGGGFIKSVVVDVGLKFNVLSIENRSLLPKVLLILPILCCGKGFSVLNILLLIVFVELVNAKPPAAFVLVPI